MTVITLSRQLGAHGEEIAAGVAAALTLRLIDAETIDQAAKRVGVPHDALVELLDERQRGLAAQVLNALRTMPNLRGSPAFAMTPVGDDSPATPEPSGLTFPFTGLFSPTAPPISASLGGYVHMVGLVVRGLAREGDVLIVGRGGQALLRMYPGARHVQIVAPLNHRIEVVMAREGLDRRDAQGRIRASDRARFDYVRRYHNVSWLDSTLYHLVINTGRMPNATAVELIVAAEQALAQLPDGDDVDE